MGEAAKIRAMVVRKTKTDRRDARHLLDLLRHDRSQTVWVPDPATRNLCSLLSHRARKFCSTDIVGIRGDSQVF